MENAAVKLEDLLTDRATFKLKATGEREHTLRLVNLEDQAWIKRTFGAELGIQYIFQQRQWDEIAKIAYRLLEDKAAFPAFDETVIDDEGETVTRRISGPQSFMRAVTGLEECTLVLKALLTSIRLSNPQIDEVLQEELKKNLKKEMEAPAGAQSSI